MNPTPHTAIVDGHTQLFFMLGSPVAQVKAPQQLNPVFARQGRHALLLPLDVPPEQFATVMQGLMACANVRGFIFTVPHKFAATQFANRLGPEAARCGVVNAMVRLGDGRWLGEMFDGQGFLAGLQRAGHVVAGAHVLLVGAGGAGTAIAAALLAAGAATLDVFDLDTVRAESLRLGFRTGSERIRIAASAQAQPQHTLLVNATPLGLAPSDPLPIDLARLSPGAVVSEAVMTAHPTPLLHAASARGNPVLSGHHMLSGQMRALEAFLLQALPSVLLKEHA